jgi:lipopolysaccharide export system permease protein
MNTYTKFISINYSRSLSYVFFIMLSLVIILNVFSEIEFFKNYNVNIYLPLYLAFLNSFDLIFEMFPFIFLIATQLFFVNLFTDNQLDVFKYSGLQNLRIIITISLLSFIIGIVTITLFYSFSSNLKNLYLGYKNQYSTDNKYLAVVTNNGLWIKDIINNEKFIINADKIEGKFLKNVIINKFDKNFKLKTILKSETADIQSNNWVLYNTVIFEDNEKTNIKNYNFFSNFNFEKINSLFSDLSSLSLIELFELKKNYNKINYSTTAVDLKIHKLFSFPFYFALMTFFSSIIMFNTKRLKNTTVQISIGLFICVIIYYLNSFFQVLGASEKIPLIVSVWVMQIFLIFINLLLGVSINEK